MHWSHMDPTNGLIQLQTFSPSYCSPILLTPTVLSLQRKPRDKKNILDINKTYPTCPCAPMGRAHAIASTQAMPKSPLCWVRCSHVPTAQNRSTMVRGAAVLTRSACASQDTGLKKAAPQDEHQWCILGLCCCAWLTRPRNRKLSLCTILSCVSAQVPHHPEFAGGPAASNKNLVKMVSQTHGRPLLTPS